MFLRYLLLLVVGGFLLAVLCSAIPRGPAHGGWPFAVWSTDRGLWRTDRVLPFWGSEDEWTLTTDWQLVGRDSRGRLSTVFDVNGLVINGVLGASLGIFAYMVVRWRRPPGHAAAGRCTECGYDLRGNTTGVCPECGQALGASARMHPSIRKGRSFVSRDKKGGMWRYVTYALVLALGFVVGGYAGFHTAIGQQRLPRVTQAEEALAMGEVRIDFVQNVGHYDVFRETSADDDVLFLGSVSDPDLWIRLPWRPGQEQAYCISLSHYFWRGPPGGRTRAAARGADNRRGEVIQDSDGDGIFDTLTGLSGTVWQRVSEGEWVVREDGVADDEEGR